MRVDECIGVVGVVVGAVRGEYSVLEGGACFCYNKTLFADTPVCRSAVVHETSCNSGLTGFASAGHEPSDSSTIGTLYGRLTPLSKGFSSGGGSGGGGISGGAGIASGAIGAG